MKGKYEEGTFAGYAGIVVRIINFDVCARLAGRTDGESQRPGFRRGECGAGLSERDDRKLYVDHERHGYRHQIGRQREQAAEACRPGSLDHWEDEERRGIACTCHDLRPDTGAGERFTGHSSSSRSHQHAFEAVPRLGG